MPNGRKLFLYGLLGLLLSATISSFLYLIVYPQTIRTLITEDTIHKGNLVISGNQEFIIDNATYFNDGNIIVQDQAKLILKNAVLIINQSDPKSWFSGSEPTIEEPISYPLYYLKVRDNAQFEAFNAVIKSPTTQHFDVYIENEAKIVLSKTNITETLHFRDDSTGSISDSYMEFLLLYGNSVVSISNSTFPQSWFSLSQNAIVSIINSTTTRGGEIQFWRYFGTMYFNQTRIRVTLWPQNSAFHIIGSVIFDKGSEISHIVRDNVTYWNWQNSNITRIFDINVAYLNGTVAANIVLELYDQLGNLLWDGATDEKGKANVEITFSSENFLDSFELVVAIEEWSTRKNLTLLSSTPVYVSLSVP